MSKHILNLVLATLILIVGGCATYERTAGLPPLRVSTKTPEHITLKTDGPSGQSFAIVLTLDGSRREIFGVTPTEFELECVVLVAESVWVDGDGSFHFVIERQDGRGRFHTPSAKDLRCFRYHDGGIGVLARK